LPDFLLELLSEEIPARMQPRAGEDLARLFEAEISKAGLKAERIETFSTPRRLALIACDLPAQTEAVRDELKGPRTSAPPQALGGFLRKTGLTQDQLTERDGVWFAVIDKPGEPTAQVLAEAVPAIVRAFPWPKSMRWGAASLSTESLRWVRPLQGIVALLGDQVVPFEIDGIQSGAATVGHRFHHPGRITIGSADDYAAKLRACHVIVDHEERRRCIAEGARAAAAAAGLTLVEDEALLTENAGLTEWPVPLLGSFDPAFLDVPPEVIQLTMATNQKYFAVLDGEGRLAPNFVCTANIEANDGGAAIVAGNQKVLAARLSDAKFFWEQDLKVPLEEQARKLHQIVFHEKLGTVADKVERVAKLARWLCEEGIIKPLPFRGGVGVGNVSPAQASDSSAANRPHPNPSPEGEGLDLATLAETAARLCKADLVTGMVGEFPELQGVMGGYYARAQGYPDAVADAIRDHYKPVGQGDEVPTAPVTVAVSLADKLDTVLGFFANNFYPTGSKDPYALRRATLAALALCVTNGLRLHLDELLTNWIGSFFEPLPDPSRPEPAIHVDWEEMLADPNIAVEHEVGRTVVYRAGVPILWFAGVFQSIEELQARTETVWDGHERLLDFVLERLRVALTSDGYRHDIVAAAQIRDPNRLPTASAYEFDVVRLLARVKALQAFVETPEGADLLAGYKRAANILKKEGWGAANPLLAGEGRLAGGERGEDDSASPSPSQPSAGPLPLPMGEGDIQGIPQTGEEDPFVMAEELRDAIVGHEKTLSYTPEPEEQSLIAALDSAEPRARAAVEAEDFEGAMAALASLRGPVDAFFDKVTVNDPDPAKRAARLNLLARMRDAVHQVADFSRIEG
jgi:glycyl-tRNA synthetase beta chain